MLVKICGISTKEAAKTAVEASADFIGFVFAPSKRKVTPEAAKDIANIIPSSIQKVGVFVNESVEKMIEIAEFVGLDYIQLHGEEPVTVIKELPFPTIKAFSVDSNHLESIQNCPSDYYLIDSPRGKYHGGTGKTFNWNLIQELEIPKEKLLLAGGLTAENVTEAIQIVQPVGVDVSSGVETNGEKDIDKMKQFISNAKSERKEDSNDNLYHAR